MVFGIEPCVALKTCKEFPGAYRRGGFGNLGPIVGISFQSCERSALKGNLDCCAGRAFIRPQRDVLSIGDMTHDDLSYLPAGRPGRDRRLFRALVVVARRLYLVARAGRDELGPLRRAARFDRYRGRRSLLCCLWWGLHHRVAVLGVEHGGAATDPVGPETGGSLCLLGAFVILLGPRAV